MTTRPKPTTRPVAPQGDKHAAPSIPRALASVAAAGANLAGTLALALGEAQHAARAAHDARIAGAPLGDLETVHLEHVAAHLAAAAMHAAATARKPLAAALAWPSPRIRTGDMREAVTLACGELRAIRFDASRVRHHLELAAQLTACAVHLEAPHAAHMEHARALADVLAGYLEDLDNAIDLRPAAGEDLAHDAGEDLARSRTSRRTRTPRAT